MVALTAPITTRTNRRAGCIPRPFIYPSLQHRRARGIVRLPAVDCGDTLLISSSEERGLGRYPVCPLGAEPADAAGEVDAIGTDSYSPVGGTGLEPVTSCV